jgi:hypothetical protein
MSEDSKPRRRDAFEERAKVAAHLAKRGRSDLSAHALAGTGGGEIFNYLCEEFRTTGQQIREKLARQLRQYNPEP